MKTLFYINKNIFFWAFGNQITTCIFIIIKIIGLHDCLLIFIFENE